MISLREHRAKGNTIKFIYEKTTANIFVNEEKLEAIPQCQE